MSEQLLTDLSRAKTLFQQRAILAAMGVKPEQVEQCPTCGDHDCVGGLPCETGDGNANS